MVWRGRQLLRAEGCDSVATICSYPKGGQKECSALHSQVGTVLDPIWSAHRNPSTSYDIINE